MSFAAPRMNNNGHKSGKGSCNSIGHSASSNFMSHGLQPIHMLHRNKVLITLIPTSVLTAMSATAFVHSSSSNLCQCQPLTLCWFSSSRQPYHRPRRRPWRLHHLPLLSDRPQYPDLATSDSVVLSTLRLLLNVIPWYPSNRECRGQLPDLCMMLVMNEYLLRPCYSHSFQFRSYCPYHLYHLQYSASVLASHLRQELHRADMGE
jgi:hypothetical protein